MREKLLELMKNEGLKPGQLAELLGINPAGISHILAGRNKPGFDLLQKILRRFPQIDPDWLLLDGQTMYRPDYRAGRASGTLASAQTTADATSGRTGAAADDRATGSLFAAATLFGGAGGDTSVAGPVPKAGAASAEAETAERMQTPMSFPGNPGGAIARIVVFYADGSFESYSPRRR